MLNKFYRKEIIMSHIDKAEFGHNQIIGSMNTPLPCDDVASMEVVS